MEKKTDSRKVNKNDNVDLEAPEDAKSMTKISIISSRKGRYWQK
jgi:hypothetical protein